MRKLFDLSARSDARASSADELEGERAEKRNVVKTIEEKGTKMKRKRGGIKKKMKKNIIEKKIVNKINEKQLRKKNLKKIH